MDGQNKMTEQEEERMVYDAFRKLLDTYLASNHRRKVDIITRAFNFAKQAHKGVRRLSGEPYIMHPIAVAQIVCEEIGLGSTSISAALLHDVEEDTDYTHEDIQNLFGEKIANIVEGLTKIAGGIFGEHASLQAETFKKLLLTMSEDIRVILIKIADRLHNMRTLQSMAVNKQYKIAGETLYIYAPLADRLGLNKIKTELEDLSFKYEHPDDYRSIGELLASTQAERDSIFREFVPPIKEALNKLPIDYEITSRVKTPYSIWCKMQNKHVSFDEIFDILAIRIVFTPHEGEDETELCFSIYTRLTKIYKSHPDRLRDWVNHPKTNGYRALHVTLMSHQGKWIEVQIRSKRMDEQDEQGLAAHWKYKEQGSTADETETDKKMDGWLHTIKEILDDPQPDTLDLLDTIKLNLFASEIFVFTPKGEMKSMPTGATVLDFAFSIHSFLGTHCIGAKVNHKLQPINFTLQSGDQVEILTSRRQQVEHSWLSQVTTAKAKSKIQAVLRKEERENTKKGEAILKDFLEKRNIEPTADTINHLAGIHNFDSPAHLLAAIGRGEVDPQHNADEFLHGEKKRRKRWLKLFKHTRQEQEPETHVPDAEFVNHIDRKKTLVLTDLNIDHCTMAKCCHPVAGDDALGYIDTDTNSLIIHKRNCSEAMKLKSHHGNNIISVSWNVQRHIFEARISVSGIDEDGMLFKIAEAIYKHDNIPVSDLEIHTHGGIFEALITVRVHTIDDINHICSSLRQIEKVHSATRFD